VREFKCAIGRAGTLEISAKGNHEKRERSCEQEAFSLKRKKMGRELERLQHCRFQKRLRGEGRK